MYVSTVAQKDKYLQAIATVLKVGGWNNNPSVLVMAASFRI